MGFVKNLEEQLSTYVTHVEELRFNHTQQELVKQKDVCLAETIELQGFERGLELLREESFQVGNEVHDKVQKLGGELVAMRKERVVADDAITALIMVIRDSIEKERLER